MGTNYYIEPKPPCEACGRPHDRLHIGKSSAGWCFSLHVDPENGPRSLTEWVDAWSQPGAKIVDEYGGEVTPERMLSVITARAWRDGDHNWESPPLGYLSWSVFHTQNHSERGPKGVIIPLTYLPTSGSLRGDRPARFAAEGGGPSKEF